MNEIKPTYTHKEARIIQRMFESAMTEKGKGKYDFEVDLISGDLILFECSTGLKASRAEVFLIHSDARVVDVFMIIDAHLRDMVAELAVKEFLE